MVDSLDRAQKQELLRTLWLEAKSGALTAREQAKAWALRDAWRDSGKTEHGMCTYIAGKLTKTDGAAPKSESVKKLLEKWMVTTTGSLAKRIMRTWAPRLR